VVHHWVNGLDQPCQEKRDEQYMVISEQASF